MEREVSAGVHFLKRMALERGQLEAAEAERFAGTLQRHLCDKYSGHWYKDCPSKGQAFRCLQVNGGRVSDDVLLKACSESGLRPAQLGLPRELTLWIDPLEVCARSGDNCRPFTVARFQEEEEKVKEEEKEVAEVQGPASRGGEEEPKAEGQDAGVLDTSDYHSATSSSCGSPSPSDAEEEVRPAEVAQEEGQAEPYVIAMVPRCREPARRTPRDAPNKAKFARNLLPATLQYFYQPAGAWPPPFKKSAPVFLTPVVAPLRPPAPVFRYYFLPPAPPPTQHFMVPQAALQPVGAR